MSNKSKSSQDSSGSRAGDSQQPRDSLNSERRSVISGIFLFPTEDRARFKQFYADMYDEIDPEGIQQELITSRIIVLTWRLKNLGIFRLAQNARKEFAPFLRETFDDTLLAHNSFSIEYMKLHVKNLMQRESMSVEEKRKHLHQYVEQQGPEAVKEFEELLKVMDEWGVKDPDDFIKTSIEKAKEMFSPEQIKEMAKQQVDGTPLALAFYADVVTPENYLAELKLAAAIEQEIDKNRERLRKLKKERQEILDEIQGVFNQRSRIFPPY